MNDRERVPAPQGPATGATLSGVGASPVRPSTAPIGAFPEHRSAFRSRQDAASQEERALADAIAERAHALREGSEGELTVRQAVALAVVQLGLGDVAQ